MDKLTTDRADLLEAGRLDDLCKAARDSERRRAHLLLHSGHQDQVQRLVIAVAQTLRAVGDARPAARACRCPAAERRLRAATARLVEPGGARHSNPDGTMP